MSGKKVKPCSVRGCPGNLISKGRHLFSFPKEHDRWLQWVRASGRLDLKEKGPQYSYRNCHLCSFHFERKWLRTSKRRVLLHPDAIPTRFGKDLELSFKEIEIKTEAEKEKEIEGEIKEEIDVTAEEEKDKEKIINIDNLEEEIKIDITEEEINGDTQCIETEVINPVFTIGKKEESNRKSSQTLSIDMSAEIAKPSTSCTPLKTVSRGTMTTMMNSPTKERLYNTIKTLRSKNKVLLQKLRRLEMKKKKGVTCEEHKMFLEKILKYMAQLRSTPTAHHIRRSPFIYKDLYSCTHVFLREEVKKSLRQPCTGPYKVVRRDSDHMFTIRVGPNKTLIVSTERLKPAYVLRDENDKSERATGRRRANKCKCKIMQSATPGQLTPVKQSAEKTNNLSQSPLQSSVSKRRAAQTRTMQSSIRVPPNRFSIREPTPIAPALVRSKELRVYSGSKTKKFIRFSVSEKFKYDRE